MPGLYEQVKNKQQQRGGKQSLYQRVATKAEGSRRIMTPSRAAQSTPTGAFVPSAPQTRRDVPQTRLPERGRGTDIEISRDVPITMENSIGRTAKTTQAVPTEETPSTLDAILDTAEALDILSGEATQLPSRLGALALDVEQPEVKPLTDITTEIFERGGFGKASPAFGIAAAMAGDPLNFIGGIPRTFARAARTLSKTANSQTVRRALSEVGFSEDLIEPNIDEFIRLTDEGQILGRIKDLKRQQNTASALQQGRRLAQVNDEVEVQQILREGGVSGRRAREIAREAVRETDPVNIARRIAGEDFEESAVQSLLRRLDEAVLTSQGGAREVPLNQRVSFDEEAITQNTRKVIDSFESSSNQRFLGQVGDLRFTLGDFGESALSRKSTQQDRLSLDEIQKTINEGAVVAVRRGADEQQQFRHDNLVTVFRSPDGEVRAVVSRQNRFGDEEVINAFSVSRDEQVFIDNLGGTPSRTRTGTTGLEGQRSIPLTDGGTFTVQNRGAPVNRASGQAAERLNFPTSKTPMDEKTIIQRRRAFVRDLRNRFGLTDSDLRKIGNNRDVRLMSNYEFKRFIDAMEQKAVEVADTKQAKLELMDVLERKHLQKTDNLRQAMGLPPVSQMSAEQMRRYTEALEPFQVGDEFLTRRTLEVLDRTDLSGVKTMREVKERLLNKIKEETGQEMTLEEVEGALDITGFDRFRYDTSLAEKNPFLGMVVQRVQTAILEGQSETLKLQRKVDELAKAARKSRPRGLFGSVRQFFVPKYEEVIRYLEADPRDKTRLAEHLTPEEMDYANFVSQYYGDAYDWLVRTKELQGSRFVDQYFTHTRKTFLEEWSDNGILNAFRNLWKSHKEDQMWATIIDQDTGNILPKSKFFQYTLQRTGDLDPSQNLTRVFMNYARMFERKKILDSLIPEITAYTDSLTPKNLTPRGLETDRRLKTFMNEYMNNKKGRRASFGYVKQNSGVDISIKMANTFVSLRDLGLAVGSNIASVVGEQVMTYQALGKIKYAQAWKRRLWDTGVKRLGNKNSNKILKEAEPFTGRNIWTELAEADQQFGDRALKGIFGIFSQSSVEANKIFLLGSLSKQEIRAGEISANTMARLRLEAGRWRDMGRDMKSIVGSTSIGEAATKYRGWAIPIARTNIKNLVEISRMAKRKQFGELLTSRELQEIYRAIEMSTVLVLLGNYVISQDKDDTFVGKMKARAYQEAMTILGGADPTLFLSAPRIVSFAQELADNLVSIAKWEQYQQDSQWGSRGDLRGARGIQRQFTPNVFQQFSGGADTPQTQGLGIPRIRQGGGAIEIPKLKTSSGAIEIPE